MRKANEATETGVTSHTGHCKRSVAIEAGAVSGIVTAIFLFVFPAVLYGKQASPSPWLQDLVSQFPDTASGKILASAAVALLIGCLTGLMRFYLTKMKASNISSR